MTKPLSVLDHLDAEIAVCKAQALALTEKAEKLRAARDLLAGGPHPLKPPLPDQKRKYLSDSIEQILLETGSLDAANLLSQLKAWGQNTTLGTVNTTLSKMKVQERVINKKKLWDLTASRRKALSNAK